MRIACLIFFLWNVCSAYSQDTIPDSIPVQKKPVTNHSPRTASILSAIVPGAGQVYNRKYWKVPIIYAGLGGFGYFFMKNQNQYTYYRQNLIKSVAGDSTINITTGYSNDQLQTQKLLYRKYRDMFGFALIAVYAVNIIDANVDAHLKSFDVSDDLSLQIKPKAMIFNGIGGMSCAAGISLKLNFK